MSTTAQETSKAAAGSPVFATTHWSVVVAAGGTDTPRAREALTKLCQAYWYPIYAFIRRRGRSAHDAQDLTQEFFARLLEKNWMAAAEPGRGRFRSFLLGALNHFLANEWRKEQAQKRGGYAQIVQLDAAEIRYGAEPADNLTPERQFERKWAVTLLDLVLQRLAAEFKRENKGEMFEALKPSLVGDRDTQPYAEIAGRLGISEGAVKVAVHRLRKRYRQLFREAVAETIASLDEIESEVRHLISVLAAP